MIKDFPITEHFSFYEMTDSKDHPELVEMNREDAMRLFGAENKGWVPDICSVLEKIEWEVGSIPKILSGHRYWKLNMAVGGAVHSQHRYFQAADITFPGHKMISVYRNLLDFLYDDNNNPLFHQMYLDKDRNFIHIGVATGYNDGQHWVQ